MTRADEAVLVLAFNRPDRLRTLIDRLREVQPPRVYLAVDGPRADRPDESAAVQACRDLLAAVDWPCERQELFQEVNLGCGLGVTTAIGWFFENEERGIILEDDIVPDPTFFGFCAELLERYADDPRVFAVSGCNYVPPAHISSAGAYRFSRVPHIWGWATWRRSWVQHRLDITGWRGRLPLRALWEASDHSPAGLAFWAGTFELLARKQIDTWDGQLVLASMAAGGLTATSNVNLVENLGFGEDATHTVRRPEYLRTVEPISLPTTAVPVVADRGADAWTRTHVFRATLPGLVEQGSRYVRQRRGRSM